MAKAAKPTTPLRAGAEVEIEIERIVPGGAGLAHAQGHTLFVPLAAPGDRLRVRVERVRGAVAFASVVAILAPGPARVEPPCPYFGRCGGCDFQQLDYEAQLRTKVALIHDCLRRIARLDWPADIPITPAPAQWHYRARARWQHDPQQQQLGYYELGSHNICDVSACPVVLPAVQDALTRLRTQLNAAALPARTHEFAATCGDDGVSLSPPLEPQDAGPRTRTIAGERYQFNADCFFQSNHALLPALIAAALAAATTGERAVDLYCGVGLFTLPLARRYAHVVGIEANPTASAYARRNLAAAQLTNARIETAPVGQWLTRHAHELAAPDFLLLDPPRAGAEPAALAGLIKLRPRRIAYVSCDPATLARDLRQLNAAGYIVASIAAFDLFPQTHHVETVVQLTN